MAVLKFDVAKVLNAASRRRDPLDARARTFGLCPVTAKFLQLRCGSMLEEPAIGALV